MTDAPPPRSDDAEAAGFAEDWIAAWNAHDLDRIMGHYSPDVTFTSPLAPGTVSTAPVLRRYFEDALDRNPDLRFDLLGTFEGVDSVTVVYRNHRGRVGAETMIRTGGVVIRGIAHYGDLTTP